MRLDHLLSRESDVKIRLDLMFTDRGNEFQDCSILKVLRNAKALSNRRSEKRVGSEVGAAEQAATATEERSSP